MTNTHAASFEADPSGIRALLADCDLSSRIQLVDTGKGGLDCRVGAINTASDNSALNSNTTGNYNTASGAFALF
jgi:hypothetical protein